MNYSKFSCIIGTKNTGKTTYCIAAIQAYMSAQRAGNNRKVIIVDTDIFSSSYSHYGIIELHEILLLKKGVARVIVPPGKIDSFLSVIMENEINNVFIIIEDSRKYFKAAITKVQEIYLRDVKNKGRETLIVGHFFVDIPPGFFKMSDRVIIKKTNETLKNVRDRTDHPDILAAYKEVNAQKNRYFHKIIEL